MTVTIAGPALVVDTCIRRLRSQARVPADVTGGGGPDRDGWPVLGGVDSGPRFDGACDVSWYGHAAAGGGENAASEATVQALSGLMHIHGREGGSPRRLGLELASVAAGLLATQGVLAAQVACLRGATVKHVGTSVLQAALTLVPHYIAQATCGDRRSWSVVRAGAPVSGPPFPTSDGRWLEIETLDPAAWKRFWLALGVPADLVSRGWRSFAHRYSTAVCELAPEFRAATAAETLTQIASVAQRNDVSTCQVRDYVDVLSDNALMLLADGPTDSESGALLADCQRVPEGKPRRSAPTGQATEPLGGLLVIEVTNRIQGPLAGQLLRMLGADVTRVEPIGGDFARSAPPLAGDTGAVFLALNRGKKPVQLDLRRPAGRAGVRELLAAADVLICNLRPQRAVEWERLASVNSSLVLCHATAWGTLVDCCPQLGLDYLVQAYMAVGAGVSPIGEPPFPSRALIADVFGALLAVEGVLRGLRVRETTRRGCRVTTSMIDGVMALQSHVIDALKTGRERGRLHGRPVWGPLDAPIRSRDGYVVVSTPDERSRMRLRRLCGARVETDIASERAVLEWVSAGTSRTVARDLTEAGIPAAPVCTELRGLPSSDLVGHYLEEIGGAYAPRSPWTFSA